MSDDFQRGLQEAEFRHSITQMNQRVFGSRQDAQAQEDADMWEERAEEQRDRARNAEKKLAATLEYVARLEAQANDRISLLDRRNDQIGKLVVACSNAADDAHEASSKAAAAIAEKERIAKHYEDEANRLGEMATTYIEETHNLRKTVEHYEGAHARSEERAGILLEGVRSSNAMLAALEAIYKMLMLEVIQKHDPATFDSLDPNKRIAVMDHAWLSFMQTDQYEHSPDLTFSFVAPSTCDVDSDHSHKAPGPNGHVDQEPEGNEKTALPSSIAIIPVEGEQSL